MKNSISTQTGWYFKTLGYPIVPGLFLVGATVLEVRTLMDKPQQAIMGIVLMLLGLPLYFYWKARAAKP